MNPQEGVFDFREADELINRAVQDYGFQDIAFSFCATPDWAASKPRPFPEVIPYWGTNAASAPSDMSYWREFLVRFVERYAEQIDAYEAWNEGTSKYLWQGTPTQMAEMTRILNEVVDRLDPTATVVSANSQVVEQSAWFKVFFPAYMKQLALRGWPVDAVSIHSYAGAPTDTASTGLVKRASTLRGVVAAVKSAGVPRRIELWDTETNYLGEASVPVQQALLTRTFLDNWRFGITRTYWYMWVEKRDPWLGVHLEPGAPANRAYDTLVSWTRGASLRKCTDSNGMITCEFAQGGKKFTVAYMSALKGRGALAVNGRTSVCPVNGGSCRTYRKKVPVTYMPVKIG